MLGPGAVGGALAVRLVLAGRGVVCVSRAESVAAIGAEGLTLAAPGGTVTAHPEALERLERPVALLLITVKAPALPEALERVAVDPALVVPLLNGLEHLETLRDRFGAAVAAGSISHFEAHRSEPTRIEQTTEAAVVTVASTRAASLLRAPGIEVRVETDERKLLWEKLVRLAPLAAVTALAQRPVGELRADPEWRAALVAALEEACAVAAADGSPQSPADQWAIIDVMAPALTTSAARDVAAGRPSELDAIAGAVVRAGGRLGVPTPTLEGLLARQEEPCRAR